MAVGNTSGGSLVRIRSLIVVYSEETMINDCEEFFRLITDVFGEELKRGEITNALKLSARSGEQCLIIVATQYYQLKFIAEHTHP